MHVGHVNAAGGRKRNFVIGHCVCMCVYVCVKRVAHVISRFNDSSFRDRGDDSYATFCIDIYIYFFKWQFI